MEEGGDFSLSGKLAVTETNLRDEYFWKLVADFIGPQTGEGLELHTAPCKNRVLIQVGLMKEENNFPWIAIVEWLKKIFPSHQSADFRRLIERGIATTLSLGSEARLMFLESNVNFNFVGPICDSIGVERSHLLEMRDFSERAQSIEVTNGLIVELSNFIVREKIAPVILVHWLRNFNPDYCKKGDVQKAYKALKGKLKKLKMCCRNYETRSHRRNAAMENLLQTPFELVPKKYDPRKFLTKKRIKKDDGTYEKVKIKEEFESFEIMQGEGPDMNGAVIKRIILKETVPRYDDSDEDLDVSNEEETSDNKEEVLTLLDIAMLSVQKLSSVYGGKTPECKQVAFELLKNQYIMTCKEHPAMVDFEKNLKSLSHSLASPVLFLNCNANFLVDLHDAVEQQIMCFEKEIIQSRGERLGRDKMPKFSNFVNFTESATSRYIHMACDILSPRTPDKKNHRKHWVAFCEEKKNPSRLAVNSSNRFNNYFEAAAGLIHHHREIPPFFSDLISLNSDECPNVILESIAADANDSMIQSFVCVLAIVYCKVLGPYWQLLKSGSQYSHYGRYLLCLYQKFLDWSKNPVTLLEPEENTNVFLQFPLQEKSFCGVFNYCGEWHTNRDLIRACLKRVIKVIAGVTEEHLKDFLPGGKFSEVPSPELSSQLESCTFSVLMAEYPFSHTYPYKKKESPKTPKQPTKREFSSGSSQEDNEQSGSSGDSSDEVSSQQVKKFAHIKNEKTSGAYKKQGVEEVELNMDRNYIITTVHRNGGPCRTQQDVDKLMLRFDGKSRIEKREGIRCEILYQKMILNNLDPNLNCFFRNTTEMMLKLKLALPRIKPGYSLVLAPRKTKPRPVVKQTVEAAPSQSSSTKQP
ncbi:uncharacterized protein LOC115428702 [Sphaeramia orbicularis]|uniref:Uncharacterized LOC115428702 n=1 Tax=Sphaeramia orbicularis TaxID=375764 RepID=A0A672ZCL4_9TELE|nr:uncharacterized protein LOC115428702 [Sphaeramia orbicularis]XP_030003734.1 uncharacterized protein LOC115428702 [Sphaeramia orbicularis]XP_030003735.1 uncharacterized protein LOC115428702 [Sphaeramia orbicularis]